MRAWVFLLLIPLAGCVDQPEPVEIVPESGIESLAPREIHTTFHASAGIDVVAIGFIFEPEPGRFEVLQEEDGGSVDLTVSWTCASVVCPMQFQLRRGMETIADGMGDSEVLLQANGLDAGAYEIVGWSQRPGVAVEIDGTIDGVVTPKN